MNTSADLPRIVGSTRPGTKVQLQIWHKGGLKELAVVVGEIAQEKLVSRNVKSQKPLEQAANRLGLVLSELTVEQKRELKISTGLIVEEVHNNRYRAELKPGDIILSLIARGENTEIRTVEQFNKLLTQFDKTRTLTLLVRRGELQTFVTLKGSPD